ncbi:MAG: tetratricopeptide repeat protein [Endomicrobiales bacterium]
MKKYLVYVVAALVILAIGGLLVMKQSGLKDKATGLLSAAKTGEPAAVPGGAVTKAGGETMKELDEADKKELEEILKIKEPIEQKTKLVMFYREHGDADKAVAAAEELVAQNGDWGNLVRLGESYTQKGDFEKAEKCFQDALKQEQKASYLYRANAEFYVAKKDFVKAKELLKKSLDLSENDENKAHTYAVLARLNMTQKDLKAARENAEKAIQLGPNVPYFKQLITQIDNQAAAKE